MYEYIAELSNLFSLDELTKRNWLEIVLIVLPTIVIIFLMMGYIGFLKSKFWQWTIYAVSFVMLAGYLPYELTRQSTEMSRAQANVDELQGNLQAFLDEAKLGYVNSFNDEAVAKSLLDELINGLDAGERKELIMISWLMSENEKLALGQIDNRQKVLADDIKTRVDDIKTSVTTAKSEIIDSRAPVEAISGDVVKRLETEVNHMLEDRMNAFKQEFKQEIDGTLGGFENDINGFIQAQLGNYEEKLATITQQNVEELRNYSSQANRAIAQQVDKINQTSLRKLDDTKVSIDGIGTAINNIDLQAVINHITQLSTKMEKTQKRNDAQFAYIECMRTTGMIDLGGKKDECKTALDSALAGF